MTLDPEAVSGTESMRTSPEGHGAIGDVFRIVPGMPVEQAMEHVSDLLGCVHHLIREADHEDDRKALSAAYYLSGFAKAIMNDVELVLSRAKR